MVTAQVEIEPANCYREGGVGAHGDEEECAILEVRALVGSKEYSESRNRHRYRNQCKDEAVFEPIREERDDERENEGSGPGRDRV